MTKLHIKSIILISISMLIFSCSDKDSGIGYDILPDEDKVVPLITDTITLETYTMRADTLVTSQVWDFILGKYNDPVFGSTEAGFIVQFYHGDAFTYPDSMILDNIEFQLYYSEGDMIYGDKFNPVEVEMYELTSRLYADSLYRANFNPDDILEDTIIGGGIITLANTKPKDSIAIPVKPGLVKRLIEADDRYFTQDSADFEFRDFFKGVYVKPVGDMNSLLKFRVDEESYILVQYHFEHTPDVKLKTKLFAGSVNNARINLFKHDYSGTAFYDNMNTETNQEAYSYIQGMSGLETKIKMPFLDAFSKDTLIVIHRAELLVQTASQDYSFSDEYPETESLYLLGQESETEYFYLPDYIPSSGAYQSVNFNEDTKIYSFDISTYVKQVISGELPNYDLILQATNASTNFNRTVINSGIHTNATKLVITYSKP